MLPTTKYASVAHLEQLLILRQWRPRRLPDLPSELIHLILGFITVPHAPKDSGPRDVKVRK